MAGDTSKTMDIRLPVIIVAAVLSLEALPALADCADAPEPKVDWRRCYFDRQNLSGLDLSGARMRDATFSRADLSNSNLNSVDAFRAKFVSAILKGVQFENARLEQADFTKADLSGASLVKANLRRARLFRTNFRGADLTGARMGGADLLRADFTGATWIDGKRICSEGSIGRCIATRVRPGPGAFRGNRPAG